MKLTNNNLRIWVDFSSLNLTTMLVQLIRLKKPLKKKNEDIFFKLIHLYIHRELFRLLICSNSV